uniref:Uncharacterized protein n=1 Tax=Poecilia mexicana TaxID=48701 RepID=A0A3B3YSW9_9TELE
MGRKKTESQVKHLVTVLPQRLDFHTRDAVIQTLELPVPRHGRSRYPVVTVEQLPPQELISGDRLPLSAGQAGSQHGIVGQVQEDLQNQAVRQNWTPIHPNILEHTQRCEQELSSCRFLQFFFFLSLKGFRSN